MSRLHSAEEAQKTGFPSVDMDDLPILQFRKLSLRDQIKCFCNCQCSSILNSEKERNIKSSSVLTVKFMKKRGKQPSICKLHRRHLNKKKNQKLTCFNTTSLTGKSGFTRVLRRCGYFAFTLTVLQWLQSTYLIFSKQTLQLQIQGLHEAECFSEKE